MTVRTDTFRQKVTLDTPILSLFTLNWELVLYIILFVVAIFTRFYALGDRVMSHDESLHTLYSWNLYAGKGYQHDPLMHGPFLFHINALMYLLFGDNDFTARISVALFGVILVILPYWFRPWLGRIGALAVSLMLLISPGVLYYSRYIRNESYVMVWTALMVLAFFGYMRTRANRWLYIGAAAVSLMLATKEVAYIHGFIGVTFILLAWMWESVSKSTRQLINYGLLLVAGILILALTYLMVNAEALTVPASEGNAGSDPWHTIGLMIMVVGLLIAAILAQVGLDRTNRPVSVAIQSVRERMPEVGKAVLVAGIFFVLLYTTFFSNISGLATGTVGAVTYWLAQQEVQRGGQPWYYYLFLIPLYEFLPVLVGLIGGLVYLIRGRLPSHSGPVPAEGEGNENRAIYPSDGGTFASFTIYWTLLSFIIYTWAGEKMPWLSVHMTLPLIFLAGHVIQTVLDRFDWHKARHQSGLILAGLLLLFIPTLIALLTADPFQSQSLQSINQTLQFITAGLVLLFLAGGAWFYGRRLGSSTAWRVAFSSGLLVLGLLTVRFTWLLNYVNYDYVNEFMVYAHGGPDVKLALGQIEEISRRTVGDKMIKVAYDNDSTWPLEWYMREYPNRAFYGENPTREALDAPVVIVGSANENKVKPFLGERYTRFSYRLVWWPIEDYKGQTLQRLWETYVTGPRPENPAAEAPEARAAREQTVRDNWRKLGKIIFYRDYEDYKLNEWPYLHRFYVYVRKDVLNDMWDYQSGPVSITQAASLDPYDGKRLEVNATQVWGSNGTGTGQFVTPRSLAVGPDGSVYVLDTGNNRIQVFDQNGNFLQQWGEPGAGPGQFNEPWGIAVAGDGTIYVADTWNHRVQVFDATGQLLRTIGTFANVQQGDPQAEQGNFWGPRDLAVDAEGNVYVTDTGNKRVQKFSPEGQFLQAWGGGGVVPGSFEEPTGIDIDSQGNIYVADTWNRRIQKFDPNLNPVAQWEVVDGWQSEGVVNKPGLAVDDQGRVFISDPEGYRIIAYTSEGQVLGTWGQYGQDLASLALPVGLDFNDQGQLLVADSENNRVMKFAVPEFPQAN